MGKMVTTEGECTMITDQQTTFSLNRNLQNSFQSHNYLSKLAYDFKHTNSARINLDLSNVTFIASNLFAVLGSILFEFDQRNKGDQELYIVGMNEQITEVIKKNGFCKHLNLEKLPDIHNTVIPYMYFPVCEIEEYERYLTLNLVTGTVGNIFSIMTPEVRDDISDSLLELFKNVSDHTSCEYVFTCGQYFPKSYTLYFTIVDMGETISYNVNSYHDSNGLPRPNNPLEWAMENGNTTSLSEKPRGVGLTIIRDFILSNKGELYIFSNNDTYELRRTKERFQKLDYPFPGTVVTIGFNLKNCNEYYSNPNNYQSIQF